MPASPLPSVDPTAALLWAACRPEPDLPASDEARRGGADLERAAEIAIAQRTGSLLWRVVQQWTSASSGWCEQLRHDAVRCRARAVLVYPRIGERVFQPLDDAGLPPLVLKGAAIAERYPSAGLRPMDDVDLLYADGQVERALEVLKGVGWREVHRDETHYAVGLIHSDLPGLPLDVHSDLVMPHERGFHLTVGDLWRGRRSTTLFGGPAYGLEPEVELLLLATHAAKRFHTFDRLLWAVDAAVLISTASASGRSVDWSRVAELARKAAARSAVSILLTQAGRLGAVSPAELRQLEGSKARRQMLEPLTAASWPLCALDDPTRHRLTYALIDDPILRARWAATEVSERGLRQAPRRGISMVVKVVRRWWWLRRGRLG